MKISPGMKSSEFLLVVAYALYILLTSLGIIDPSKVASIQSTAPAALDALSNVVNNFGDQTLLGGLILAYVRRRYNLKKEDIDTVRLKLQADIEKCKAIVAVRGASK
jgi:hypothetical protein